MKRNKTISSILNVVEPNNLDITKDLEKDEKTAASIKELFEDKKDEQKEKD